MLQELKQELKEQAEQQEVTRSTVEQLVTTSQQLQEQVRCRGSSQHPPAWWGGPGRVPGHILCLAVAMEPPRHPGLLAASIPSRRCFLLPFVQVEELRAMVRRAGQEQAERQAVCPMCRDTSTQGGNLLQHFEKLQEQVDSLLLRQEEVKVEMQKIQVRRW